MQCVSGLCLLAYLPHCLTLTTCLTACLPAYLMMQHFFKVAHPLLLLRLPLLLNLHVL
jgi:hypothetical protein